MSDRHVTAVSCAAAAIVAGVALQQMNAPTWFLMTVVAGLLLIAAAAELVKGSIKRHITVSVIAVMAVLAVYAWFNWPQSRTHLQVVGVEMLPPTVGSPLQLNVFYRNRGEQSADVRIFPISVTRQFPQAVAQAVIEAELLDGLRKEVAAGRQADDHIPPMAVHWFTVSGAVATQEWIEEFRRERMAFFVAVKLVYTDKSGDHVTSYCTFTDSRPNVNFLCRTPGSNAET